MKVFATSDLHIDYPENARWLANLSLVDFQQDVLIVAGDVTHEHSRLAAAFEQLARRFRQVLFVPGNHDLWVRQRHHASSYEKFEHIRALAERSNVSMRPFSVGPLTIVPLLAWYDYSFGSSTRYLLNHWSDYFACDWIGDSDDAVTQLFLQQNEPWLELRNEVIISFSHFLPRIDLMPDYIPPTHRQVYPVLGTSKLDQQIRTLGSHTHVYGHSHVNLRTVVDGVTYINNAFGSPRETRISSKALHCVYEG